MAKIKKFTKKLSSRTKSFSLVDYGVSKLCILSFGLWVATILPIITEVNPWIYLAVWTALYAYLLWRIFKK